MTEHQEDYGIQEQPTLFTVSSVNTALSESELEQTISDVLRVKSVTILEKDDTNHTVLFMTDPATSGGVGENGEDEIIVKKFQDYVASIRDDPDHTSSWLLDPSTATTCPAEMEEEEFISEDEAYEMWLHDNAEIRTTDLPKVATPDGDWTQPSHDLSSTTPVTRNGETKVKQQQQHRSQDPIQNQLQRDPTLFELDNVRRMKIWEFVSMPMSERQKQPLVLTGFFDGDEDKNQNNDTTVELQNYQRMMSESYLIEKYSDATVRTGNRETLIENGFNHSKPLTLKEALKSRNVMVFSPIDELSEEFHNDVSWAIPGNDENPNSSIFHEALGSDEPPKYTLCVANQGFGIGMHKHTTAMFVLVIGRKKWYMSPPEPIDDDIVTGRKTHPEFYTSKSSHKCIQHPGEVLYVPNLWYHEIFNLDDYTAGIQALCQG